MEGTGSPEWANSFREMHVDKESGHAYSKRVKERNAMSNIFYIIGVVVVVLIILSFLGLR